ncbi:putative pyridine nucleotide-disulfide oxidoreductase domain-containing protein 1 isoform X2 [Apostichopus japonicus]|uniref:Pyridine nucleotide-disulfide oxidoreductase domain-containing protein 1 n=1 Tax=Stichopus japonicus TaxID=307972 RepID=A0A2G8JDP0_STIJA|nr:putative pyridine nucleotide-disulfide oxidoreductase domain-containing protein 1 isoform X2 [Apostichopus japonicus]
MADTDTIVVIGGGIAGVSCTETLSTLCKNESITLVTASPLIKAVTNFKQISRRLEEFDVVENPSSELQEEHRNVTVLQAKVVSIDPLKREIVTSNGKTVPYTKLCICTGGSPKLIMKDDPNVIGIRDTESVSQFQTKLGGSRRVIIVGNGGIATELAYEIEDCEVVWAIKDKSISSTFVDAGTAQFFLPHLSGDKNVQDGPMKRVKYTVKPSPASSSKSGAKGGALGPDWSLGIPMNGQVQRSRHVRVEYECEIKEILSLAEIRQRNLKVDKIGDMEDENTDWPVYALLTNDKMYGCDFIVSATGVVPNGNKLVTLDLDLKLAADGGVIVNNCMKTNIDHIYAAGDVCSASWDWAPHWLQMRLWSQARQMGCYAAQCIKADLNDEAISLDFCFELFAHVTKFFGYKVILLGKFNGQGLDDGYEILLRMTKGVEYIKVILKDGRMQGAILIGETDLEETFENLILNQLDLSRYGEDLLDPGIDIDDYFD